MEKHRKILSKILGVLIVALVYILITELETVGGDLPNHSEAYDLLFLAAFPLVVLLLLFPGYVSRKWKYYGLPLVFWTLLYTITSSELGDFISPGKESAAIFFSSLTIVVTFVIGMIQLFIHWQKNKNHPPA